MFFFCLSHVDHPFNERGPTQACVVSVSSGCFGLIGDFADVTLTHAYSHVLSHPGGRSRQGASSFSTKTTHFSHMSHTHFPHISAFDSFLAKALATAAEHKGDTASHH